MTETDRAPRPALGACGVLLAALIGLGGCAADVAPSGGGYAQAPGVQFHTNAEFVGAVGAGSGK